MNIAKIKGTHNAMKSGMLAAESAYAALEGSESESDEDAKPVDMSAYDTALRSSWVWDDLKEVRNLRQSFNTSLGLWGWYRILRHRLPFLEGTDAMDIPQPFWDDRCQTHQTRKVSSLLEYIM